MHLTLNQIRDVMRRSLGPDSFTAGFVSSVIEDSTVPTACINASGELRFNPSFVAKHVRTDVELFCLIFHELLHPAFGHFIHPADEIANIACDAIINAIITHVFAEPSGGGSLFLRFYPERGLPALLRPFSRMGHSRYQSLYCALYPHTRGIGGLSAGEVIQSLRVLVPDNSGAVILLGSHGQSGQHGQGASQLPAAVASRVADDLLQAVANAGGAAGHCPHLQDLLIEVLKHKATVREELLARYATRHQLDSFFGESECSRRVTSPFPINPSRRDLVLLGAGIWPGLFRNRQPGVNRERRGVAIFLDVSGSVNEHLPAIIGLLASYRDRIKTVFLFSNTVVETSLGQLAKGRVRTTYGTDFNCLTRTIVDKELDRAVILTDGYASLDDKHTHHLRQAHPHLLTILFGGKAECPDLEPFGEVVQLADVTE